MISSIADVVLDQSVFIRHMPITLIKHSFFIFKNRHHGGAEMKRPSDDFLVHFLVS